MNWNKKCVAITKWETYSNRHQLILSMDEKWIKWIRQNNWSGDANNKMFSKWWWKDAKKAIRMSRQDEIQKAILYIAPW